VIQRAYQYALPMLAVGLLLFAASPALAGGWCLGRWVTPCCPTPQPSLPIGNPCHGYNRTLWQTFPAACPGPQAAILAPPVSPAITPVEQPMPPIKPVEPTKAVPNTPAGEPRATNSTDPELFASHYHAARP
jgi:hypothetical protein